jgi:hypothetical protein
MVTTNKILKSFLRMINSRTFAFIANITTIGSLVFAVITLNATNKLSEDNKHNIADIKTIMNSFSTYHIGEIFPKNIPVIIEMLEKAEQSIEIYVDFITYGTYSSPINAILYLDLLSKKRSIATIAEDNKFNTDKFKFDMHVYKRELADSVTKEQFPRMTERRISNIKKQKVEYKEFLSKSSPNLAERFGKMTTSEEFFNILSENEEHHKPKFKTENSFHLIEMNKELPCFMWIIDGKEAIISFQAYKDNAEYSIRTKDKKIIEIIRNALRRTGLGAEN